MSLIFRQLNRVKKPSLGTRQASFSLFKRASIDDIENMDVGTLEAFQENTSVFQNSPALDPSHDMHSIMEKYKSADTEFSFSMEVRLFEGFLIT